MKDNISDSDANKAFLRMLIENRIPLTKYPERVDENLVVFLSAPLPFAGKYHGLKEYYGLVPRMQEYYDYNKFELIGVFADDDIVFVTIQIGLKHSEKISYYVSNSLLRKTELKKSGHTFLNKIICKSGVIAPAIVVIAPQYADTDG